MNLSRLRLRGQIGEMSTPDHRLTEDPDVCDHVCLCAHSNSELVQFRLHCDVDHTRFLLPQSLSYETWTKHYIVVDT